MKLSGVPPSFAELKSNFKQPAKQYYPETWFHLNGKNISQEGLTADLEAISYSGMQGIQLFNKKGPAYPNVPQVPILTPEWEDMIGHVADETERLGLNLTFQNCPGWSMAGGPWVPAEESQRELVEHVFYLQGGQKIQQQLALKADYLSADRNYQDVQTIAFKTPKNELLVNLKPISYETNNKLIPWDSVFEHDKRVSYHPKKIHAQEPYKTYQQQNINYIDGNPTWVTVQFADKTTLRSVELPPIRTVLTNRLLPKVNIGILVESQLDNGQWQTVAELDVPTSHWYDNDYPVSFNLPETRAKTFKLTFTDDPLFLSYVSLNGQVRLHNHQAKAAKSSRELQTQIPQFSASEDIINPADIINLTTKVNSQGQLNWQAPEGSWTVIRFGHVNMLKTNKPAEPEATGWETSKLDKVAIENHLRNGMMGNLMRAGGPLDGHDLHGILIDSWESGVPTWTIKSDQLPVEFKQRRGYDMLPYMPATLGYVVDSVESSNKFLRDLRETMDDLYVENFFDHFRTVSHDMGAKVYTEGATGETLPGDPLRYYGVSDFPMTEFWYPKSPENNVEAKPIYAAASAYHLYDKPFLAAEAATQLNVKWNESPLTIQGLINENFSKGINHLVFHTFSHTPQTDVLPGSSFGGSIGFPLLRTQTWWRHTPTWLTSLARTQYLLQQGQFVADVLWYLGDELDRHPFDTHPFPDGYKFDYLNAELLHSKVKVTDGQLHVEGAGQYKIIMLRDSQRMLLSTAEKLKSLVAQGAIILGNKPVDSASLMDDEQDFSKLKQISDELWGNTGSGVKSTGKGKVYWGQTLEQVIAAEEIQADVQVAAQPDIRWLHRTTADAEIYYVTNQHDSALDVSIQFRDGAGQVEVWDIDTGEIHPAQLVTRSTTDNSANVLVQLKPHGSQFVVFNKTSEITDPKQSNFEQLVVNKDIALSATPGWYKLHSGAKPPIQFVKGQLILEANFPALRSAEISLASSTTNKVLTLPTQQQNINLDKPWQLQFDAGWDTPETITLKQLQPLNTHSNPAIRHFSGSVIYQTNFEFNNDTISQVSQLDLGQVHDIAEVWLNDKLVATRLSPPYQFDVSEYLQQGSNQLRIVVTNTWRNQLIFDNTRAKDQKKTWTTNPPKAHETQLEPSGLIGPVQIKHINLVKSSR
ncbi:glycosyl hydrolase [Paraglaciecola sp.]|uniref:glycosyl hydrolase n=1 Tax=Paraglaciecola sp. TaxID=1920173 RepID=UPI003EF624CE